MLKTRSWCINELIFATDTTDAPDTTPPVISDCPHWVVGKVIPGRNEGLATWIEPTATDDDGQAVRVSRTNFPSTYFPPGPTTVQYFFTDSSGNEAECSFIVEIKSGRGKCMYKVSVVEMKLFKIV